MLFASRPKFTSHAQSWLDLKTNVGDSLRKLPTAFGKHWDEWSGRVVLVVETNLRERHGTRTFLTAEPPAEVIIIADHVDVYGRAISGFIGHASALFVATLAPASRGEEGPA